GRVVDLRQRRDRQQAIGEGARKQDGDHEERGRHRPADKEARGIHSAFLPLPFPLPLRASGGGGLISGRAPLTSTCAPGRSRSMPSTTTTSPAVSPSVTATRCASAGPSFTTRCITVLSGRTT